MKKNNNYAYPIGEKLYLNLTNKCSNNCEFCIRNHTDNMNDYYLWLDKEPTSQEVISAIEKFGVENYKEVVFCGFGEPTCALDVLLEVGVYLKQKGIATRMNTNGQANIYWGKNVVPQLAKVVDTINVSLNETDAKKYDEVCHSVYGLEAFQIMLDFAVECKKYCKKVVFSVVDCIGEQEIAKAQKIADSYDIPLRVRVEE
ncbi:MAG: TatD family nuclease-associated radical SAM protein [Clostridia bacterium]